MKLTAKDAAFLETLRRLSDEKQLSIELKEDVLKRLVLRQNYGDRIRSFHMTRQGVRWRFNHIFNQMYVSAYLTILLIESRFGAGLRHYAMAIAKQRAELRQEALKLGQFRIPRRQHALDQPNPAAAGIVKGITLLNRRSEQPKTASIGPEFHPVHA